LKPANILIDNLDSSKRLFKITDFGISKYDMSMMKKELSKTLKDLGSPYYVSPE
jgi:serine/threonine protein kinase